MLQTKTSKVLHAEEYQQHIPLFLNKHTCGFIHSTFKNGFNISVGGKLFFIGSTRNGELPFGIHIDSLSIQKMLAYLEVKTAVKWDIKEQELHFLAIPYKVSLQKARSYTTHLRKRTGSIQNLSNQLVVFLHPLLEKNISTGLGCSIEDFMYSYVENNRSDKQIAHYIYRLLDALYLKDRREIERTLRFFLGRGQGLTPSGDDLLVGVLAINSVTSAFSSFFLHQLQDLLVYENLTTDVGKEYLFYALKGEFSSSVINVIEALLSGDEKQINNNVDQLLAMGHSSGADTLFGILIGLLALRRKLECQKK